MGIFGLTVGRQSPKKILDRVAELIKEEEVELQKEYEILGSEMQIFRNVLRAFADLKKAASDLRYRVSKSNIYSVRRAIDEIKANLKKVQSKTFDFKNIEKSILAEVAFHEKLTKKIEAEFNPEY